MSTLVNLSTGWKSRSPELGSQRLTWFATRTRKVDTITIPFATYQPTSEPAIGSDGKGGARIHVRRARTWPWTAMVFLFILLGVQPMGVARLERVSKLRRLKADYSAA